MNTDDVIAHYRRECACGTRFPDGAHPNEACPYNRITDLDYAWYTVRRTGKPRSEGGSGVSWYCSCQDGNDDQTTCAHIGNLMNNGSWITTIETASDPRAAFTGQFQDIVIIL